MRKIIAFFLAALTLCPLFAACGSKETENSNVDAPSTTPLETEDSDAPSLPSVEEIGDISGDFHILVSGNWAWNDYASGGEEGSVVDAAIYRRNQYILNKYNVNVTNEDIVRYSSTMGSGDGYTKIYTDYMAGDNNYDAAMIGTYDVATLAYNGYLHNLNDIPNLDLTKPYWDQRANEDLSINGKMYYTTGDISVADNRATYVLFFSKNMVAKYGLDNPYDLVNNNEWTLEKFGEMVKSVGADENNDGIYDKNDTFGLLTPRDTNVAILAAANERICTINDAGQIELTFYSERIVNLYDRYLDIVSDPSHTYNYQYNYVTGERKMNATDEERVGMFNTDHALFYSHTMFYMDHLRDIESDFGILPYPKFDKEQEKYGNLVSAWHSQFLCVPENSKDLERTGIILEELAYQGKQLLTPAYYEKTLVGQYTRDEESAEMLDLIFANLVYDVGIYYNIGTYKDCLTTIVEQGQSLTTIYDTYRNSANVKISRINEFFSQAGGN